MGLEMFIAFIYCFTMLYQREKFFVELPRVAGPQEKEELASKQSKAPALGRRYVARGITMDSCAYQLYIS